MMICSLRQLGGVALLSSACAGMRRCLSVVASGQITPNAANGHIAVDAPTAEDLRCITERQLGHMAQPVVVPAARCQHGYPQAFAYDLLRKGPKHENRPNPSLTSGMFRLTCPLLVRAIDEWEARGAVAELNEEVRSDAALTDALTDAHRGHADARRHIFAEQIADLRHSFAAGTPEAERLELVLASGIAGQTISKVDVKCLHAQAADALCRPGANVIGERVLAELRARGVPTSGCADCRKQCSAAVPVEEAKAVGWWYTPRKNKWKLRTRRQKRAAKREEARHEAQQVADGEIIARAPRSLEAAG